jgi:hypothetical protein
MISAASAMPMPETGPSVTRNWMKANAIAAVVYTVAGALTLVTDKLLAIDDPATAMLFRGIAAVIALAGTIVPIIIYAMLTGAVLGEKLPAFSRRGWIVMHASIGAVLGITFAAFTLLGTAPSNATPPTPSLSVLATGLGVASVFAAMFGAAMGGLQALVLRKAATGAGKWIALSTIATPLILIALGTVAFGLGDNNSGLAGTLVMQLATFAAMIGGAVIMLPAVKGLTPRG